jgi:hypothetical protein
MHRNEHISDHFRFTPPVARVENAMGLTGDGAINVLRRYRFGQAVTLVSRSTRFSSLVALIHRKILPYDGH